MPLLLQIIQENINYGEVLKADYRKIYGREPELQQDTTYVKEKSPEPQPPVKPCSNTAPHIEHWWCPACGLPSEFIGDKHSSHSIYVCNGVPAPEIVAPTHTHTYTSYQDLEQPIKDVDGFQHYFFRPEEIKCIEDALITYVSFINSSTPYTRIFRSNSAMRDALASILNLFFKNKYRISRSNGHIIDNDPLLDELR